MSAELVDGPPARGGGSDSAGRVAQILLQFLGESGSLGVTEIARRTGVSKAAVHRSLTALSEAGLVRRLDGGRYRISPLLHEVGRSPSGDELLIRAAHPPIRQLAATWNETVFVSTLDGLGRVAVLQEFGTQDVRLTASIGRRLPLTQGATGFAMLSRLAPTEQRWAIELAARDGDFDAAAVRLKVDETREQGFAATSGSRHGTASAVSVALVCNGGVTGAITVIGPPPAMEGDRVPAIADDVMRAAAVVETAIAKRR